MKIDMLLRRLEEEQASLARQALQQPQERDVFEYGRVVGMHSGLERAKQVIIDLIAEKEKQDFGL
jgi:hypothetical protein